MKNRANKVVTDAASKAYGYVSAEKTGELPLGNFRPDTRVVFLLTQPDNGLFKGFHHVKYYCSNAFQTASYFTARMGFEYHAYSNLDTGSRDIATHVIKNGDVLISFESELKPTNSAITRFLATHGDTIQDIAFEVEDLQKIFDKAVERGAKVVSPPQVFEDEHGSIIRATIHGFGDTVHTLIERVL